MTAPRREPTADAPLGSRFDRQGKRPSRAPHRRLRAVFSWGLTSLAVAVVPALYDAWWWLVWRTSRVDDRLTDAVRAAIQRHGRAVGVLWHDEVFGVAYAYRRLPTYTLASAGTFGRIVTALLERHGQRVFRGGGSAGGSSRRRPVLLKILRHLDDAPAPYLLGLTVDGSHGPPYRLKAGAVVAARRLRAPVFCFRVWWSRGLRWRGWDRSGLPLPFGRIALRATGPYWIDPDADAAERERFRDHLEQELLELTDRVHEQLGDPPLRARFPADYDRRWFDLAWGLALGPHDLSSTAPPWAAARG